jgi:hypothetical protein
MLMECMQLHGRHVSTQAHAVKTIGISCVGGLPSTNHHMSPGV